MGKGISCIDPFALNTLIDVVKSSYLYQPSSTECAKMILSMIGPFQ